MPNGIAEVKFTARTSKAERVKLALIWHQCLTLRATKATILTQPSSAKDIKAMALAGPIKTGTAVWIKLHDGPPKLQLRGTDYFCGLIFKDLANGIIAVYGWEQRCGFLDTHLSKRTIKKRDATDAIKEEEIEEAPLPDSILKAKRQTDILSTTITLMSYAIPNSTKIAHKRSELTDYYDFFWGSTVAGQKPSPSLDTLMAADIAAWKRIAIEIHQDRTLPEALKLIKEDALFWVTEVTNKVKPSPLGPMNPGHQNSSIHPAWLLPPPWPKGGPGRGPKGKGRGRGGANPGRGRGIPTAQPISIPKAVLDNIAASGPKTKNHPAGQPICRNFLFNRCWGKCGRLHGICPRKLPSGEYCYKHHSMRICLQETPQ